jgi:hypothetical protein
MGRIARVAEEPGPDAGAFYVEPPDIPDGLTCQQWRRVRPEIRRSHGTRRRPLSALRTAFS